MLATVSRVSPGFVAVVVGVVAVTALSVAVATVAMGAWAAPGAFALNLTIPAVLGQAPIVLLAAGKLTVAGQILLCGGVVSATLLVALVAALITKIAQSHQKQVNSTDDFVVDLVIPTGEETAPATAPVAPENKEAAQVSLKLFKKGAAEATEKMIIQIPTDQPNMTINDFRQEIAKQYSISSQDIDEAIAFRTPRGVPIYPKCYNTLLRSAPLGEIWIVLPGESLTRSLSTGVYNTPTPSQ